MAGLFEATQGWDPTTLEILHNMQDYQQKLQNGGNALYNPYEVGATKSARNMFAKGLIDQDEYDNLVNNSNNVQKARSYSQDQINQRALGDVTNSLEYAKTHPGFASDNGSQGFLWDALDIVGAATLATGLAAAGSAIYTAMGGAGAGATGAAEGAGAGAAGAVGGVGATEGGLGALGSAAAGGAAEGAIPSVIVSAPAGGAAASGLGGLSAGTIGSVGGVGLSVSDILNGTNMQTAPSNSNGFSLSDLKNYGNYINNGSKIIGAINDYTTNQQNKDTYNNTMSYLQNMYAPGSPEEQALRQRIEAQDAAAGRRSQYGPREVQLAGIIAQNKANLLSNPTYASYLGNYTKANSNSLNSVLGALGSMYGGTNGSSNGTSNSILGTVGNWFGGGSNNNSGSNLQLGDDWMTQGKNLANSLFGG